MKLSKKLLAAVLILTLALSAVPVIALANSTVTVTVDGEEVIFTGQGAIIVNERTYVPVNGVLEAMGFTVWWDHDSPAIDTFITVASQNTQAFFDFSQSVAWVSHDPYIAYYYPQIFEMQYFLILLLAAGELDVTEYDIPPMRLINGQPMLPLRAVIETLGGTAQWDGRNRVAKITSLVHTEGAHRAQPTPSPAARPIQRESLNSMDMLRDIEGRFPRMSGLNNHASPAEGGTLTVALPSNSPFDGLFNAVFTRTNLDYHIFEWVGGGSIFSMTPEMQIGQHGIATWRANHEESSITITQVEDVYWHDGHPLTLGDLVFAKEIIASPGFTQAGGIRWTPAQQNIVGSMEFHAGEADYISGLVLSEDERELTIYFIDFTPSLLYFGFWTHPYPRHIFADVPMHEQPTHYHSRVSPVGWGPFIMDTIVPGESVSLIANNNFWLGKPYLDRVYLEVLPWDIVPFAVQDGFVDIARLPTWAYPHEHDPEVFHILGNIPNTVGFIAFNMGYWDEGASQVVPRENTRMGDVNLRRAMAHAVDFTWVGDVWFNGQRVPASSINPPAHRQFLDPTLEGFAYDPSIAMALLDEAGFKVGPDGWRTFPDGSELVIRFAIQSTDDSLADFYAQSWENIGLKVYIDRVEWSFMLYEIFQSGPRGHDWDLISTGWSIGANPDPNNIWGNSINNRARFTNPAFETHMAGFNSPYAWDLDWLTNHHHQWQRLFHYYVPAFPTTWRVDLIAVNNRVINYYIGIPEDGLRTQGGFHNIQVTQH